jgi:nucleoside-diphosphate-sugar epimerase
MGTVLVTGASGFIGSHLVNRCLGEGQAVKALVRKGNPRIAELRKQGADVVEGDVRDADAVDRAVRGCDIVFHAAAITSDWGPLQDFRDINIGGTRKVCDAALRHGVSRLVHISSFESFDHSRLDRIDERTPYTVRNASYADTKIGGNEAVREFSGKGLDACMVYPVWVYGPGDRTLFPLLADSIRRRLMFYWARGARMSMIYIDNLVDLLLLAARHPAARGEGFMACDREPMTFEGLCERIASRITSPAPALYLPYRMVCMLASLMEGAYRFIDSPKRPLLTRQAVDVLASRAEVDTSKAHSLLGWSQGVPQEEGIRRTLDWLVSVDPSEWKLK